MHVLKTHVHISLYQYTNESFAEMACCSSKVETFLRCHLCCSATIKERKSPKEHSDRMTQENCISSYHSSYGEIFLSFSFCNF